MRLKDYTKYYVQKFKERGIGIRDYKKRILQHGIGEFCLGLYSFMFPTIFSYIFPGIDFSPKINTHFQIVGGYFMLEGFTDISFRQRKHHIVSSILEKFGINRFSVPKVKDLEKYLDS